MKRSATPTGPRQISKSGFKAHALQLLRDVERTGSEMIITDKGKPVVRLLPFRYDAKEALAGLRGSVRRYERPLKPVGEEDWEALR